MKLVLASQSPRRRDLLGQMGLEFDIISPQIDEDSFSNDPGKRPWRWPGPRTQTLWS